MPSAFAQTCPAGYYQLNDAQGIVTWPQSSLDASYDGRTWISKASYDALVGDLAVSQTLSQNSVQTDVVDEFMMVGLAPGATATVQMVLDLDFWVAASGCDSWGCGAVAFGRVSDEFFTYAYNARVPSDGSRIAGRDSVRLSETFTSGQWKKLAYEVGVGQTHGSAASVEGAASGALHFHDLPPGASMISCWGYGAASTPGRRSSWGSLKLRYH